MKKIFLVEKQKIGDKKMYQERIEQLLQNKYAEASYDMLESYQRWLASGRSLSPSQCQTLSNVEKQAIDNEKDCQKFSSIVSQLLEIDDGTSGWRVTFLNGVKKHMQDKGWVSDKQKTILLDIYGNQKERLEQNGL